MFTNIETKVIWLIYQCIVSITHILSVIVCSSLQKRDKEKMRSVLKMELTYLIISGKICSAGYKFNLFINQSEMDSHVK